MTRRVRWRRWGVLSAAVVVVSLGGVLPVALADTSRPAAGFANAVLDRVNLLSDYPFLSRPPGSLSWADLQSRVAAVATHTDASINSTVVDPQTATPWELPKLLQQASGQSTWLGASASADRLKLQLTQVLGLLVWRLADRPPRDSYGIDFLPVGRSVAATTSASCDPPAAGAAGPWHASAELTKLWQQQFGQALAGSGRAVGTVIGTEARWYRNDSGTITVDVTVSRDVWRADLPQPPDLSAPFAGVRVDAARLFVELLVPLGETQQLTVLAAAVARGTPITQADFAASGTALGTVDPTLDPRYQTGLYRAAYDFDPALLLRASKDPTSPRFVGALRLRLAGEEPPPGFPPSVVGGESGQGGSHCGWQRQWSPQDVAVLFREALPPLAATVRIAHATLAFEARAKRRVAKLKQLVETLAPRKETLEREIVTEVARAQEAVAGVVALERNIKRVDDQLGTTRSALDRLKREEDASPAELRSLLENEDRFAGEVAALEQQVLAAEQQGATSGALRTPLALARKQLAAVDAVLKDRFQGTPLGDTRTEWLSALRTLQSRAFELRDAEVKLLGEQGAAEGKLTLLTDELRGVDIQLLGVAERLAGFDPEVSEVSASVGGQPVFHAVAGPAYARVLAINEQIADQAAWIKLVEADKKPAFDDFVSAQKDAIASGKQLAELLNHLAYARFVTDLAFDSYDIVKATAKGGAVGAVAELGKKLIEKGLSKLAGEAPSGIDEQSIEAEINKEFNADLKDAFSAPRITRVVAERVIKDTASKALKDSANKYIGALVFKKVELPFRRVLGDGPITPGALRSQLEKGTLELKSLKRLRSQLKDLRKGYFKKLSFKGEAENIAKDALKTLIKGALDSKERDAWVDYFQQDAVAHALYGPYHELADRWQKALERQDALLAEKAKLLAGADPNGGLLPGASSPFDPSKQVTVTLKIPGFNDPADPVEVLVGGVQATRVGNTDSYTVDATNAKPDSDGALTVELR